LMFGVTLSSLVGEAIDIGRRSTMPPDLKQSSPVNGFTAAVVKSGRSLHVATSIFGLLLGYTGLTVSREMIGSENIYVILRVVAYSCIGVSSILLLLILFRSLPAMAKSLSFTENAPTYNLQVSGDFVTLPAPR
jgi:hypothetical protein